MNPPHSSITTARRARLAGSPFYHSAMPCKRGHTGLRRTSNNACEGCAKQPVPRESPPPVLYVKWLAKRREKEEKQSAQNAQKLQRRASNNAKLRERNRAALGPAAKPTRPEPTHCEICRRTSKKALCLDHCHVTGLFRGWLCDLCNRGLGMLGDDLEGLKRAVTYLEWWAP